MQREEAIAAVRRVDDLTHRTERRIRTFWQPALLWGVLAIGRAIEPFLPGTWGVATWNSVHTYSRIYSVASLVVGIAGTVYLYRRRPVRASAWRPSIMFVLIAIFLLLATPVGAILWLFVGISDPLVWWFPAVASFTLVAGLVMRNRGLAIASLPLLGLALTSPFYAAWSWRLVPVIFPIGYLIVAAIEWRRA